MSYTTDFISKLNESNSTNYKIDSLKKFNNDFIKDLLKVTYDKVAYNFYVTMKNVPEYNPTGKIEMQEALDIFKENLCTRKVTGNAAIDLVHQTLSDLSAEDALVLEKVLDRDLKINMGRTNINKVFKGLIVKPVYCRCDIYTTDKIKDGKTKKGTASKISFPAIINLKADGTYREISKIGDSTKSISRSGESYSYQKIEESFSTIKEEGYFTGELTVIADDDLIKRVLPKIQKEDYKAGTDVATKLVNTYTAHKEENKEYILPRSIGNGLLNSDDVPQDNIIYEVWDYITVDDYNAAARKDKKNKPKVKYIDRFNKLKEIIEGLNNNQIRVIEHKIVNTLKEATDFTSEKMQLGLEGAVLKDFGMLFKDGTSTEQLKMKIAFQLDVIVTGFVEGKKGTKREKTFGAMTYSTNDGLIKGSVSGFTDSQLEEYNKKREELIDTVIEIEGNDLSQARGNTYHAVSHPRFLGLRTDKTSTDDLERALLMLESAKEFN